MKVSTEACLFGAWTPSSDPAKVLDIGAGTGLLSLMIAQRYPEAEIVAVEVDPQAAEQAQANFEASPWSDRLQIVNQDIQSYAQEAVGDFDLIISNPPFFQNSLKSTSETKNLALHQSEGLNAEVLADVLKQLLSADGKAYVLYPAFEAQNFQAYLSDVGLVGQSAAIVKNQPHKPIFRVFTEVSKSESTIETQEISIRNGADYSPEFVQLLKPYYLYL